METLMISKRDGMYDIRPLVNMLSTSKDGMYRVEVTRVRNHRSLDQNAWLWGCIYPMLLNAMIQAGWDNVTTAEDVHEFFKSIMSDNKAVNRVTGEVVTFPKSTAKMTTTEFCAYCEKLRDYGQEFLGVTIPDPIKQ